MIFFITESYGVLNCKTLSKLYVAALGFSMILWWFFMKGKSYLRIIESNFKCYKSNRSFNKS